MKKQSSAPFLTLMLALAAAGPLSGCLAVVAGGAAVGALSIADRRSTGAQADDRALEFKINQTAQSYLNEKDGTADSSAKLSVTGYNRRVLLVGLVESEADKQFVERVARAQPAAVQVYNYIDVATPDRGLGNISNDTWITSKVRTTLLNAKGVSPNNVKVTTYNGVTYVMGILTPAEQEAATRAVSTTAGVQKVVTLYQTFEPPVSEQQSTVSDTRAP